MNLPSRKLLQEHVLQHHRQQLREFSKGSMEMVYAEPRVYQRECGGEPCVVLIPLQHSVQASHVVDLTRHAQELHPQPSLPYLAAEPRQAFSPFDGTSVVEQQ